MPTVRHPFRTTARAICLSLLLAACGASGTPANLQLGERGRVVRVIDGDALVLDTGQSVRLAGIEAPAGPSKGREGEAFHAEAKRMLEDMVLGREVQLAYGGLTRDRYDRALAQVRTVDALGPTFWLNGEMVQRGGARVRVYPDTAAGCEGLVGLENRARRDKAGLWSLRVYEVAEAEALPAEFERFQLVTGKVTAMEGSEGFGSVCGLSLEGSPLVLEIKTGAAAYCQLASGTRVLARGYVRDGRMEVSHSLDLEVLSHS